MQTIPSGIGSEDDEIFIPPALDSYVDLDETPDPSPTETTSTCTSFRSPTPRARAPATPTNYPMVTEGPTSERSPIYKQWTLRLNHYRQSKKQWRAVSKSHHEKPTSSLPKKITLATWNIDFASQLPKKRMEGAVDELRDILDVDEGTGTLEPCVVLLQEVHNSMLEIISSSPWVRQNFYVTPLDSLRWPYPHVYGNVTLVHRSLQIEKAFLLEYRLSEGARSAVMIDVKIRTGMLRIINTHLESLSKNAGARKEQLAMCARFCKAQEVDGGIIGGDLNAIDLDSEEQVKELGLRDAFQPGRFDQGFTWGYQCNSESDKRLPKGRLDKILYMSGGGFYVEKPEVVGKGARIEGGGYISDHFGLAARIVVK